MRSRRGIGSLLSLALPLFAGCGAGDVAPREMVRDSAGVAIVENVDLPGPPRWTVGAPALVLDGGASAAGGATLGVTDGSGGFGLVAGVATFDDGTIAVADGIANTVRLFDAAGMATVSAGRPGDGPGEFRGLAGLWHIDGRHVGVWDARLGRATVIESDGNFGPDVGLQATAERARHTPIGVLADGRLIAQSNSRLVLGLERYRADLRLLVFDTAGVVDDTLAAVPGVDMWDWVWEMGVSPSPVPFGRTTSFALSGDAIYVAANEGYQIDRYDPAGALVLRIRLDREADPLTPERVAAYQQAERDKATSSQVSKGGNELWGRIAEGAPYPERLPHYQGIIVDERGRIWVHDYPAASGEPTRFTVFDADGRLAGRAEFPREFTPIEMREERALGIWRDALDVEHVRMYILHER